MRFSVEVSVSESGRDGSKKGRLIDISKGYLRSYNIELQDLLNWTKSQLITISYNALREEQAKGFDTNPLVLVDGKKGKSVSDVNPLGKIQFVTKQDIGEIILVAYNEIILNSKVKTGRYQASHRVLLNTTLVASDLSSLIRWVKSSPTIKVSDTLTIINTQPYARKLELRGVSAGRTQINKKKREFKKKGVPTTIEVNRPNGTYQLVLRKMRSKYKNNVSISFKFFSGAFLGLSGEFKKGKNKKSIGRPYLYPALVFRIGGGGLF